MVSNIKDMRQVTSLNTHILLLLPVPKSIMMCLFLRKSQLSLLVSFKNPYQYL